MSKCLIITPTICYYTGSCELAHCNHFFIVYLYYSYVIQLNNVLELNAIYVFALNLIDSSGNWCSLTNYNSILKHDAIVDEFKLEIYRKVFFVHVYLLT